MNKPHKMLLLAFCNLWLLFEIFIYSLNQYSWVASQFDMDYDIGSSKYYINQTTFVRIIVFHLNCRESVPLNFEVIIQVNDDVLFVSIGKFQTNI